MALADVSISQPSPDRCDIEVVRFLAAYAKAYEVLPTATQLAEVMRLSGKCVGARLSRAAKRGVVERVARGRYRPRAEYVPPRLLEPRPYVNPYTFRVEDDYAPAIYRYVAPQRGRADAGGDTENPRPWLGPVQPLRAAEAPRAAPLRGVHPGAAGDTDARARATPITPHQTTATGAINVTWRLIA